MVQSLGSYMQYFFANSLNVSAFYGAEGDAWQAGWSAYYWGWWMSWTPFVGIFIARISRGRTVREFIAGVLLVPTLVCVVWFGILGGTAIFLETTRPAGYTSVVGADGAIDSNTALFQVLEQLPAGTMLVVGAIILSGIFFITSADSGSLVMGMLATGGDVNPKATVKIFFAIATSLMAAALLAAGGLSAIQVLAITIVTFSFGGIETLGVAAGEAKNPEKVLPKAINTVPIRILLFYVLTMAVIMALVPWNQVDGKASPFVQIFEGLGVPFAPHLLNFVVLTAAVSAINACIYASGRLLYAMAHDGQAPRAFTHTNRGGVPWLSVAVMLGVMVLGAVLITVDPNAFSLVAGVASFAVVLTWAMIFLSHRAMRRRVAEQGAEPSPFPMPLGGVGTYLGLAFVATVVITMATIPDSRQALIIGLVWVAVLTLAWFVTGTRTSAAAHDRTGTLPVVRTRQSHED